MIGPADNNLIQVIEALVVRVGLRNLLLAISAVCAERAIEAAQHEPHLATNWQTVAADVEHFARNRLQGLR
ncbi:MAG TPA: hypothetical protein VIY51_29430 [Xanthobacteraceae bacterium]